MSAGGPGADGTVAFHLAGYRGLTVPCAEKAVHTRVLPSPEERLSEGQVTRRSMGRVSGRVSLPGVGPVHSYPNCIEHPFAGADICDRPKRPKIVPRCRATLNAQ